MVQHHVQMDKSKKCCTRTCSSQKTELLEFQSQDENTNKNYFMMEAKRIKGTAQISHLYWLYFWCAHSHLFPLTTKSMILIYCMHENWTNFFDCVLNTQILPFPSFTKPAYVSGRCTPFSAHLLFSGLLSEERSSLSSHQPSLVFFLTRTFSPSLRGLHFAHSCLMHFLWDRIKWDWRPRRPHAVYLA